MKLFMLLLLLPCTMYSNNFLNSEKPRVEIWHAHTRIANHTDLLLELNPLVRKNFFIQVGSFMELILDKKYEEKPHRSSMVGPFVKLNLYKDISDYLGIVYLGSAFDLSFFFNRTTVYSYFFGFEVIDPRGVGLSINIGKRVYTGKAEKKWTHNYFAPSIVYSLP